MSPTSPCSCTEFRQNTSEERKGIKQCVACGKWYIDAPNQTTKSEGLYLVVFMGGSYYLVGKSKTPPPNFQWAPYTEVEALEVSKLLQEPHNEVLSLRGKLARAVTLLSISHRMNDTDEHQAEVDAFLTDYEASSKLPR